MEYKKIGDYYFGFSEIVSTIGYVELQYKVFLESFDMLVTCLDSDEKPANDYLFDYLKKGGFQFKPIDGKIWFPSQDISGLFERRDNNLFFVHYDEIYLFTPGTPITYVPERIYQPMETDETEFKKNVPPDFIESFIKSGAKRFLSAAQGLNFACESLEVVKKIEELEKT